MMEMIKMTSDRLTDSTGFVQADGPKVLSVNGDNPKQAMGDKKIPLHLVPGSAEIAIANGLGEGADKYGSWNWRDQPIQLMTYYGSMKRHMAAWVEGEEVDPDGDGKTHLEGAIASIVIILDALSCGTYIDDRPNVKDKGVLESLQTGKYNTDK